MSSSRSKWETFFKEAGIPSRPATEYSTTFSDNRMRLDMLEDLNKELLHDLGIKAIGDVIAILRHAKMKHAEFSRNHSPSPGVVETSPPQKPSSSKATHTASIQQKSQSNSTASAAHKSTSNTHAPKNLSTAPTVNRDNTETQSNLRTSTKTIQPSTAITKPKSNRKTLSDRFKEFERESKRKKEEDEEDQKKQKEGATLKQKSKATVFTIQLPSKQPAVVGPNETKPKQKVTLVPAQGKPLNRNKKSTSIFDRLDKTPASTTASASQTASEEPKQNVFNRLGGKESEQTLSTTTQKIQKVPAMLRADNNTIVSQTSKTSSVFHRLGER